MSARPPGRLDDAALAARAVERMRGAGAVEVAPGAAARPGVDRRLTIDLHLQEGRGEAGAPVLRAFVVARSLRVGGPAGETPVLFQAVAERPLPPGPDGGAVDAAAVRAHAERALDDAVSRMASLLRLHAGDVARIREGLGSADPDLRAEAIRVAAARKEPALVPPLIELLRDRDAPTRDRALGALVEIGDRRAVKPITQLARFEDVDALRKVIDAVGGLGGDEARAYLEFVVSAHDDPEMRGLARDALARLDRRARR